MLPSTGAPVPDPDSSLARAILRYLAEHPEARDSIDGIHAWWLEDGVGSWRRRQVEDAVGALVDEGWMIRTTIGGVDLFSLSPRRLAQVRARFRGDPAAGQASGSTRGEERGEEGQVGER